jgi:exopolysaccharide biosynthesis WecB/TagA/CpsF family protein
MNNDVPISRIAGLPIVALSRLDWARMMERDCSSSSRGERPKLLTSANGNVVSLYHQDPLFKRMMDSMDAIDADGMPLVLASKLVASQPLPERVATTDFFHDAARIAQERGFRFYLLGSTPNENIRALARVQERYPKLNVRGHHGYFSRKDEELIVQDIVESKTDVLWVGLGIPNEQGFILRNADNMRGVAWVKTCGGLINFLSGTNKRAPYWMQACGMEWIYRMMLEPRRLAYRYLTSSPHAIYLALKHREAAD